jgi:DNA polymerase II large subunit
MIFLIEYNRSEGKIVTSRDFDDSQRREAEDARLKIELDLNSKGVDHEVILLEAASEAALRRTHRRYFEDLRQILESPGGQKMQ